jgi:hypothetical protein
VVACLTRVLVGCQGASTTAYAHDAATDGRGTNDAPADSGSTEGGPASSPFSVFHQVKGGETLNAITGWDSNHFIAVGNNEVTYVFTSGKLTRLGGNVAGSDFEAVWGSSPTDVFAAGTTATGGGLVAHYDGSAWTTVFTSPTRLYGIWGTTMETPTEAVIAVGEQGSFYGYYVGSSWQSLGTLPVNPDAPDAAMSSNSPILSAITGRNFNDFLITSNGAQFFHFEPDAGGLAFYRPGLDPNTNFTAAWQDPDASATSVYVGSNFYGLYYFSPAIPDASVSADGSSGYTFGQVTTDPKAKGAEGLSIRGIWGATAKIVGVGDDARILVVDTLSGHAGVVAPPEGITGTLGGVWGSSLSDIWIVGPNEALLHGALPH